MAMTSKQKTELDRHITGNYGEDQFKDPDLLFEVTCSIGEVYRSDDGDTDPFTAALVLIAKHEVDGRYRFPTEDGKVRHVDVYTV